MPPTAAVTTVKRRPRNDLGQYDDLVDEWWDPFGSFAMLHWIAEARAALIPPAVVSGAVLVDVACGAGLLSPHVAPKGYRHVGIDLTSSALALAAGHGVAAVRGNAMSLPLASGVAAGVCAGEILEHVADVPATVAEACRVLRPGGLLVLDTIADTPLARLLAVGVAERVPGGAPPGLHDPALFVDRRALQTECARHGIRLAMRGMRPSVPDLVLWLARRRPAARMVPTFTTSVLFQGHGTKEHP